MKAKSKIYVGVEEKNVFVRANEESEGDADDLVYRVFYSARKPTPKTHPRYNFVVGPFPSEASAIVFRDEYGVNTVEEAIGRVK